MYRLALTIWIFIKREIAKRMGWIGDVGRELLYVKEYIKDATWEALKEKGLRYKKDFIDSQYDSIKAILNKEDDCDGFNRIAQCYWYNKGYDAYLVTYWAKPFRQSHTTVILKVNSIYIDCDYGYYGAGYYSLENCISSIASRYKSKVKAWIVQDINWRIKWQIKK